VATTLEKVDVWSHILQFVEQRLNKHIYDSWFRPIQYKGHDESERIVFLGAGQVTKDWVTIYYSDLLKQAAEGTEFADYRFEWKIEDSETAEERFSECPPPNYSRLLRRVSLPRPEVMLHQLQTPRPL
jgi:chromosomal replication initiation ATPase DnaA